MIMNKILLPPAQRLGCSQGRSGCFSAAGNRPISSFYNLKFRRNVHEGDRKALMEILFNRIDRKSLEPGDHIYTWRTAYTYAHHGIFVGGERVIHFTQNGRELGTGTGLDGFLVSSVPSPAKTLCVVCGTHGQQEQRHGVISSCLDCFLSGGVLCRYKYGVNLMVLTTCRWGTCTSATSDPSQMVVHRANRLLGSGFGPYHVMTNNCEHFSMYCKTGLFVRTEGTFGRSGQGDALTSLLDSDVVNVVGNFLRAPARSGQAMVRTVGQMAASYCRERWATDIGRRSDVVKMEVDELVRLLARVEVTPPETNTSL